jgi:hypothetical protein
VSKYKFQFVIGTTGPLGITHVVIQISKSLLEDELSDNWKYSMHDRPTILVFYNKATLYNHY